MTNRIHLALYKLLTEYQSANDTCLCTCTKPFAPKARQDLLVKEHLLHLHFRVIDSRLHSRALN
jgi:hypothetical protein